jgi:hypothetical protein
MVCQGIQGSPQLSIIFLIDNLWYVKGFKVPPQLQREVTNLMVIWKIQHLCFARFVGGLMEEIHKSCSFQCFSRH